MDIERYSYEVIELYLGDEKVSDIYNDVELTRVQIVIVDNQLEGYRVKHEGVFYDIDTLGHFSPHFPKGLYNKSLEGFAKLFKLRREKLKKL